MKCFERIVLKHIKDIIPAGLDQYQFAYRENRSTEDAVSIALHTALTHLQLPNTYMRDDAICGLQFSLQHSDPGQADAEAPQPGTALIAVPIGSETSSPTGLRCGENGTGDCGKSSSRPGLNIRWPDAEEGPARHIAADPTHPGKWTVRTASIWKSKTPPANSPAAPERGDDDYEARKRGEECKTSDRESGDS
ncbi:hypothetical protein L3Q82_021915 [Scortum barcoo]|uniref:Uncharacterized protein n=1 Tax=Scortum barcoo TaxID=214431 RepID=A0ACB8X6R5_9TELE|nr:hypothetical protein L3Q82_021915 [Scortum barcoo]